MTAPPPPLNPPPPSSVRPPRVLTYAVEGWGKTTLATHSPSPFLLLAEDGYKTLLAANLVPKVPCCDIETWPDLLRAVDKLISNPGDRRTVVLDALSGFERMAHQHVCDRDFDGDWGERGFLGFQRGYDRAGRDWCELLDRLDAPHAKGLAILLLGHAKISTFKNPLGPDFDRFACDIHSKTWSPTHRWADAVLFGNFYSVVDDERKARRTGKGKGIGGTDRILYTERRDGFDAKNRYAMPPEIWLTDGPDKSWSAIARHLNWS